MNPIEFIALFVVLPFTVCFTVSSLVTAWILRGGKRRDW